MKKVLIAEDHADVRALIRVSLELEDFDIHEAPDGLAALDQARRLRPHLMLLDLMMPGLDGLQVYQQVKAEGESARKLAKLTLGTQFSMGKSLWSRPSIRFYATHAKWNNAAAAAGSVACTGRDCNTTADGYAGQRNGTGYGVQVEAWF